MKYQGDSCISCSESVVYDKIKKVEAWKWPNNTFNEVLFMQIVYITRYNHAQKYKMGQ